MLSSCTRTVTITVEVALEVEVYCDPPDPSVGLPGWSFSIERVRLPDGTDAPDCLVAMVTDESAIAALDDND